MPPCSSSLAAFCPRSSAGNAGTLSTSHGVIPKRLLPGSSPTECNSHTLWPLPTAPCGIWNGGLYDYPIYGRAIRLPSHARVQSVPRSSWSSLVQQPANRPLQVAPAPSRDPVVNPPTPTGPMFPLSAQSRLQWRNRNRWQRQLRRVVQSTLGLLKTRVPMSQWRHGLQLLLLGVQAWVLLLALWGNVSAPGARRASFWTRALPVTF